MFRVIIEITKRKSIPEHADILCKTEKFYELLGRSLIKYGAPEIVEEAFGTSEYEFSRMVDGEPESCIISFAKVAENEGEKKARLDKGALKTRSQVPTIQSSPPPPAEPDEPRIAKMKADGFLEDSSYYY